MKTFRSLFLALCLIAGFGAVLPAPAQAQTTTFQTTIAAAVTTTSGKIITVTSVGTSSLGIWAPSLNSGSSIQIWVDTELMDVEAVNGTTLTVRRGANGTRAQTHAKSALVIAGPPGLVFFSYPFLGSCTATSIPYLPIVDTVDQYVENCVNGQWAILIAADVNYSQPQVITSAYTNATTTFSSTGISFPVHAGVNYTVRCDLIWQASGTAGAKYEWTGPSSPTAVAAAANMQDTTTTSLQSAVVAFSTAMSNSTAVTTSTNFHDILTLGIVNGANSGTVTLMAASYGTGTLTIQPGSFCVQQ